MTDKPLRMSRLVRVTEAGRTFDIEFWRRMGPEARLAAVWQMTKERLALKGIHGDQCRLDRSVERVERLRRGHQEDHDARVSSP